MILSPLIQSRSSMTDPNGVMSPFPTLQPFRDSKTDLNHNLPPSVSGSLSPSDLPVVCLSMNPRRANIETHSEAGSDGGNEENWTTMVNQNVNVVAAMKSIMGKWFRVNGSQHSLSSCTCSDVVGDREQVKGGVGVSGEVNQSIQLAEPSTNAINTTATVSLPAPAQERVSCFSKLNRSDWEELDRHSSLLDGRQQRHLKAVERKRELFPKRFRHDDYLLQSAILLLSNGWASAERYACCGIKNRVNRSGACKLHKFCPSCCWRERNTKLLTYVPAFDSGTWHWLTGSFVGELTFDASGAIQGAYEWLAYWDAYKAAFVNWVKRKSVRGVFWVEELAVNSMLPTKVLPHVHAIVEADVVGEAELQELQENLHSNLRSNLDLGLDHMEPNVEARQIDTARSLLDRIGYMIKPINILTAYQKAWNRASFNNRHRAQQLNSDTTDLVLGYSHITTRRNKINVKGSLDPKAGCFVGIARDERDDHRRDLAAIRAEALDEYIEVAVEQELEEAA